MELNQCVKYFVLNCRVLSGWDGGTDWHLLSEIDAATHLRDFDYFKLH